MIALPIRWLAALTVSGLLLGVLALAAEAQQPRPGSRPRVTPKAADPHAGHGTPKGWKFAWPRGDATRGRDVFVKFECYSCHEVKGESFPAPSDTGKVGPELSQMGPLHEVEYFVESIVNPGATIEKGRGYQGPDGSSKMPSFNDSMTVQEAIDLVAFLKGLKPASGAPAGHRGH
jgi:mono/diheme cytochrome c family protein